MTRLLLHKVFLKLKNLIHSFIHLLLFFYFELYLIHAVKKLIHSFAIIRNKKKFVQNTFHSKYSVNFRNCFSKQCTNDNESKLLFRFEQGKWIVEGVNYAKKIQVLLCSTPP